MSEKVGLMLKVSPVTRVWIAECARLDHRTISAYVEAFVEADAKAKKIADLDVKVKEKKAKVAAVNVEPQEIVLPDFIDSEVWNDWVNHRNATKKTTTEAALRYHLKKMIRAHENGWDVNELMQEAIMRDWQGAVYPNHLEEEEPGHRERRLQREAHEKMMQERYEKLMTFDTKGYATQQVYYDFVEAMRENHCLLDYEWIRRLFYTFKDLDRGTEWNDGILRRAIETKHFVNERQQEDVLTPEERIKTDSFTTTEKSNEDD